MTTFPGKKNSPQKSRFMHRSLLCLLCLSAQWAFADADLVLHNGTIYTVNDTEPVASAVAIEGDRITAVGNSTDVLQHAGPETKRIDLEGAAVVPGLIDAHVHLDGLARSLTTLNFVGTSSSQEIVDMVAQRAESLQRGEWVLGRGWDQNDWPEKEFPHHEAMSRRTPGNPVYLTRIDGHAAFANERALEIAGIDRATPDPDGGRIIRDAEGEATGVLIDRAQGLVNRHVPPSTPETYRSTMLQAINACTRFGLTSVHDAGASADAIALFKELADEDLLSVRVYAMIRDPRALDAFFESGPLLNYGEHRLTVRSIKAMADGALGSRGAALYEDYADESGNSGLMITSREQLEALAKRALEHGFQVCSHGIGDRGNGTVLDAYEAAFRAMPSVTDHRFRVEHAQILALKDIPRFAELGVIPSMQATHATSDMYWVEERLGAERVKGAYAWRKLLDSGVRIANGSDFPVEHPNPLWGFYAAITRQDHKGWPEGGWMPEERMTRAEALRSFTLDAAYAAFEEDLKGSIEPGKLADLVVLSRDIMTIPAREILDASVSMTIIGGKVVYERSE